MIQTFRRPLVFICAMAVLSVAVWAIEPVSQQGDAAPVFQVDPSWPKIPKQWILGQVSGVATDAQDHVWVLQRPWSLNSDELAKNPDRPLCRPVRLHAQPRRRLARQLIRERGRQRPTRAKVRVDAIKSQPSCFKEKH